MSEPLVDPEMCVLDFRRHDSVREHASFHRFSQSTHFPMASVRCHYSNKHFIKKVCMLSCVKKAAAML